MISSVVFVAFLPSFKTTGAVIASTAGLIPKRKGSTCGSAPYSTYRYARTPVITTAGTIKVIPATNNPGLLARSWSQCIVISVELGPGIKLVASIRSRKCSWVIHLRFWIISDPIIAMCAAGPPKAKQTNLKKTINTSFRCLLSRKRTHRHIIKKTRLLKYRVLNV